MRIRAKTPQVPLNLIRNSNEDVNVRQSNAIHLIIPDYLFIFGGDAGDFTTNADLCLAVDNNSPLDKCDGVDSMKCSGTEELLVGLENQSGWFEDRPDLPKVRSFAGITSKISLEDLRGRANSNPAAKLNEIDGPHYPGFDVAYKLYSLSPLKGKNDVRSLYLFKYRDSDEIEIMVECDNETDENIRCSMRFSSSSVSGLAVQATGIRLKNINRWRNVYIYIDRVVSNLIVR